LSKIVLNSDESQVILYEKSVKKKVFESFVLVQNCWASPSPIDYKVLRLG